MPGAHSPTPPIELTGTGTRLGGRWVDVDDALFTRLSGVCAVVDRDTVEVSRDWWPLAMGWAVDGLAAQRAAVRAQPASAGEVAAVLAACQAAGVPVTTTAGRSGVCGASVPVHGGVALDLTALAGVHGIDTTSMVVDVLPGTFGPDLANALAAEGATLGHWPQSIELSTVGGWLACRSAGQYSTRYGTIADMVVGLDVVLADGTTLTTGGWPGAAVGPDLTQLFVGSEGTLGVITGARLRVHPAPPHEARAAYGFARWDDGVEACRRMLQRGATPAVLRLYDATESQRSHGGDGTVNLLLVLDEGDAALVDATMTVVDAECAAAEQLSDDRVARWVEHRNDTSALQPLTRKGYVVDTMEVAGTWSELSTVRQRVTEAIMAVPHALVCTCHLSHSYTHGACLYFTFAALPPQDEREATYVAMWDAGQGAAMATGAALSHHHGIGLNRARFLPGALGAGHDVLVAMKRALDPTGILNPGKLALPDPWGPVPWP